jgi:hypothetical protein
MLRTATEAGNQLSRAPLRTSDSRVA